MEIVIVVLGIGALIVLLLSLTAMWLSDSDPLPDQELYGMSADEYIKEQTYD